MANPNIPKKEWKCKAQDCSGTKNRGRGYCHKHYYRFMKYGNTYQSQRNPNDIIVEGDLTWIILRDNDLKEIGRTVIDSNDYELIKGYKWHLTSKGYASANPVHSTALGVEHLILGVAPSRTIMPDHKNRNPLDNRRSNLRKCVQKQNMQNKPMPANNASGYKGVYLKSKAKWEASIRVDGKLIFLGYFKDKIEAAKSYNRAAVKYFGEFACINDVN